VHTTSEIDNDARPRPVSAEPLIDESIREDHILPHLSALRILLTGPSDTVPDGASPDPEEVISHLRTHKITLT
jgi:hypothetical protein